MELEGIKIGFIIGPEFQDEEGVLPREFLEERGAEVVYIAPEKTVYYGKNGRREAMADKTFSEVSPEEFDAIVIPGGRAPQNLRGNKQVINFVREFAYLNRPIAAICHGPQLLAAAGLLEGRTITSYEGIRDEMIATGANHIDSPVVVDGNLITSRKPDDIPDFNMALEKMLKSVKTVSQ